MVLDDCWGSVARGGLHQSLYFFVGRGEMVLKRTRLHCAMTELIPAHMRSDMTAEHLLYSMMFSVLPQQRMTGYECSKRVRGSKTHAARALTSGPAHGQG